MINRLVSADAPVGFGPTRQGHACRANPLYLRELVDALVREQALEIGTAAEVSIAEQMPASLTAVLSDRLSFVSAKAAEILRTAVLFGGTFAVTDLATLLHSPVSKLAADLQEAVAAGILVSSGSDLAFRHPLIQQALYESIPTALRTALHAGAARELATAGARATVIAQQLSAAGQPSESWARNWLIETAPALAIRAPQLGAELLQRELDYIDRALRALGDDPRSRGPALVRP
jgi:hypothetical protein